jgi:hypothetical protein
MVGEKIVQEKGKITGYRVLPSEGLGPKVEASFQGSGKILGIDETNMGTYESVLTPAGVLHGKGQGVIMTSDGESAYWWGEGVGTFPGRGMGVSWRGALYYQTASQKLARLNTIATVFEFESDEEGNISSQLWEWK